VGCVGFNLEGEVLKVDNIGCFFAWETKNVSKDPHASVLVRALLLISSYQSFYAHAKLGTKTLIR
jgi:hypothetical protein